MAIGKTNISLGGGGGGSGGATVSVNSPAFVGVELYNIEAQTPEHFYKVADETGFTLFTGVSNGNWQVKISLGNQTALSNIFEVDANYPVQIAFFTATINITYPEGSSCQVSDGNTVLGDMGHTGTWQCIVPNAGTWTVTATDGTSTAEKTVVISAGGQVENVTLAYEFSLYDNGYTFVKTTADHEYTIASGWLSMYPTWTNANDSYAQGVTTTTINVDNYTTLTATFKITGAASSMTTSYVRFGINAKNTGEITSSSYYQKSIAVSTQNGTFTESIDITNYTGDMYLYAGMYDNNGSYMVTFMDFVFS